MKRIFNWQAMLGLILVSLSGIVYYIHYLIFKDAHHIFLYLIGDIAFVFIEVLLVTIVIHELLSYKEKKALLNKLNMIIGAFFSEAGLELLKNFSAFDKESSSLANELIITNNWSNKEFSRICKALKNHNYNIDTKMGDLEGLKIFLKEKRQFLLTLLENPNLLEHENFTNLLWAVFHLTEELVYRKDLKALLDPDRLHISGDIKRMYSLLILEWLDYMKHLKNGYPYLFSLALRTNPFDKHASIEIK